MESEKVKEIKDCLNRDVEEFQSEFCQEILTLINELESENERLSNTKIGELVKENEELAKQCVEWIELDFKKRNKITELKDRIAELEKRCHFIWASGYDYDGCEKAESLKSLIDKLVGIAQGNWGDVCGKCENRQDNLINDKLNQFAERVKEKMPIHYPSMIEAIDKTLKEFINES